MIVCLSFAINFDFVFGIEVSYDFKIEGALCSEIVVLSPVELLLVVQCIWLNVIALYDLILSLFSVRVSVTARIIQIFMHTQIL